jgi:hypothetical protein
MLKSSEYKYILFFIILFFIFFIIYILLYSIFNKDKLLDKNINYDLNKDGFSIFKDMLSMNEINYLKLKSEENEHQVIKEYLREHPKLRSIIKNPDYIFQDYIFIIKKSSIHTCHRDNNGDFLNKNQKYSSYTMLIFLENMDKCLGVIPTSHLKENKNKYNINFTDQVKNIVCNKGDIIIFNANLIHVGALNSNKDDHLRIQMKISHKEDIDSLSFYQNYNKILKEKNNIPFSLRNMQKNLSCMFPFISDLKHNDIVNSSRGSDNGANINVNQKIFSYLFYGNSNFYDLPNAF